MSKDTELPQQKACRRRLLRRCGIWFLAVVVGGGIIIWLQGSRLERAWYDYRRSCIPEVVNRYCTSLEPVDRVEILRISLRTPLKGEPIYTIPLDERMDCPVLKTVVLTGHEANALAQLWRHQYLHDFYRTMCHEPHHVVRFYRGSHHIVDAVICFTCNNVALPLFPGHELITIDSKHPHYAPFQERIESLVGQAQD